MNDSLEKVNMLTASVSIACHEIAVLKMEKVRLLTALKDACCALTDLNQDTSELNKLIIEIELNNK